MRLGSKVAPQLTGFVALDADAESDLNATVMAAGTAGQFLLRRVVGSFVGSGGGNRRGHRAITVKRPYAERAIRPTARAT